MSCDTLPSKSGERCRLSRAARTACCTTDSRSPRQSHVARHSTAAFVLAALEFDAIVCRHRGAAQFGDVKKYVTGAAIRREEAEAFCGVEPFHRASFGRARNRVGRNVETV